MSNIPISNKIPELDLAIKAAQEAGNKILKIYEKGFKTFTKSDNSPVTNADLQSNKIIKEILSVTKHSILSEEDVDDKNRLSNDMIWIIDPLDGTYNFVKGLGKAGGDVLAMFPESAQQFIKSFQEGKEIKELAKNNPEGFLQALKTTEEKIFDLELPGVKNSATAAVFLHQSLKGPRGRRKSIRAAMKKAAAESDFSVPQIEALLANYLAMAAHAPEATTQTSLEVEEV